MIDLCMFDLLRWIVADGFLPVGGVAWGAGNTSPMVMGLRFTVVDLNTLMIPRKEGDDNVQ